MSDQQLPDRQRFQQAYEGQPPWDIGRPQPAFVDAAADITGCILDAGCGTGENALFFAQSGHTVTGIDFLEVPIQRARQKVAERGLHAEFIVHDALELSTLDRQFDCAVDCGLFHVFRDEDRPRYVSGLARVVRPGGKVFLMCFSDLEPGEDGPRRISRGELEASFCNPWSVLSVTAARFSVREDLKDMSFSKGGPKAWFAVIQRSA